jgi:pimeloyl-ACP methyl ester carboxylesterase
MARKLSENPADYIVPLNINGLDGRMLHVPAPRHKNREILLIYGHHAMLERWWTLVQNLNEYGAVTMPDMPGFGGMDSFAKIGVKINTDAYADYLAAFVKMRYRRKRVSIMAISFGFVIATRMLQKYPELVGKVDLLVSQVGYMHKDDFLYSHPRQIFYRAATRTFATRPFAFFIRYALLNKPVLKTLYTQLPNSKRRMIEVTTEEFEATMEVEVKIWQANDVRTHWLTSSQFFTTDNCQQKIDLPVIHVASTHDHYFDNEIVKQHMLVVFKRYRRLTMNSKAHTPNILADKKATGVMLPPGLRRLLAQS